MPPLLYKYEPFNALTLQNLKNHSLYFGSPLNFNDPFDCATRPHIKTPTDQEMEFLKTKPEVSPIHIDALRSMLMQSGKTIVDRVASNLRSTRGITCFSEKVDNVLMWSHYGSHHKGYCLEFSTDRDPFDKAVKVTYSKQLPTIDLLHVLNYDNNPDHLEAAVKSIYCVKSEDWCYESEWRVIHEKAGMLYGYRPESLTGVYFGAEMLPACREILRLIVRSQNRSARFWQGVLSNTEFKVDFHEVPYATYIEATGSS